MLKVMEEVFFFFMNPNVLSLKKTEWAMRFYHIAKGYQ